MRRTPRPCYETEKGGERTRVRRHHGNAPGIPARTLNDLAERHNVDAILIGSRGRGIVQQAVLGSVAFKLLQTTRKPVLLARVNLLGKGDSCRFSVCRKLFQHILFLTDFSETAEHAFTHLERIAADLKGPVTLLHVQDRSYREIHLSGREAEAQTKANRERLDALKARLEKQGVRVETELVEGVPREEILQRTVGGRYSLIAMGTQGKGVLPRSAPRQPGARGGPAGRTAGAVLPLPGLTPF